MIFLAVKLPSLVLRGQPTVLVDLSLAEFVSLRGGSSISSRAVIGSESDRIHSLAVECVSSCGLLYEFATYERSWASSFAA